LVGTVVRVQFNSYERTGCLYFTKYKKQPLLYW